ncbi:hypothetical protein GQ53DRAFT_523339 [Thozetella sp. PMI_491]|nr:hypothetical protein GQ53DRAFT_523339 [Thozetella sp. PMI_491]
MALPADLRVLCRRLTSTKTEDLPGLCPVLVAHVLRCGVPLSAPHEAKSKDKSSEASVLIHKLKTQINTLLHGRTPAGRFAAAVLVKAIVDVGGWECLRVSEPWVRGLFSVLQKPDSLASKELCIVTLTRIYSLLHGYQTLVREIATPTLPAFVTACLQLIAPPPLGRPPRVPAAFVETVASALSTIIPLYPTTLRPFSSQIRSALRHAIAPTSSDPFAVPQSLRNVVRQLIIALHHTAPKNGSGEEWSKSVGASIKASHATADWVFRAVEEYWEPTAGYRPKTIPAEAELAGGSDEPEELPPWVGLQAGAERLIGLLEILAEYFKHSTRSPVTVPVGELLDLTLRITLVRPPSPTSQGRDEDVQLNAAIGREEKDELWSVLPDIHTAALRLQLAMTRRLGKGAVPLASDVLDQAVRVFGAAREDPGVREIVYTVSKQVFTLTGPTLPKIAVDSAGGILQKCCRDLLQASGHLQEDMSHATPTTANGAKSKEGTHNADAFLGPNAGSSLLPSLSASHQAAAEELLVSAFTDLPQHQLSPDLRGLLDRTAIITSNKTAMLASCLHPYKDKNGRYYASILPFLAQRFPHDQEVEVLRSNLQGPSRGPQLSWEVQAAMEQVPAEAAADESSKAEEETSANDGPGEEDDPDAKPAVGFAIPGDRMDLDRASGVENAFMVKSVAQVSEEASEAAPAPAREESIPITLKRKGSELHSDGPKKVSKGGEPAAPVAARPLPPPVAKEASDEESDAESIEIDATFSDQEDDEEEEEEGGGEDGEN